MPTGYTADIEKGQSFEDFVLKCARAFGALLHQRDEPSSEKPRLRTESEDSYYTKALKEANEEVAKLEAMSTEERMDHGAGLRQEALDRQQEFFNKKVVLRQKYMDMLAKVEAWFPPTPSHTELKSFMISQIRQSIDFDCNTKYDMEEITRLTAVKPYAEYEKALTGARNRVDRYTVELEKQKTSNTEANQWILDLYTSLGLDL
jgi:hypothetical protein